MTEDAIHAGLAHLVPAFWVDEKAKIGVQVATALAYWADLSRDDLAMISISTSRIHLPSPVAPVDTAAVFLLVAGRGFGCWARRDIVLNSSVRECDGKSI